MKLLTPKEHADAIADFTEILQAKIKSGTGAMQGGTEPLLDGEYSREHFHLHFGDNTIFLSRTAPMLPMKSCKGCENAGVIDWHNWKVDCKALKTGEPCSKHPEICVKYAGWLDASNDDAILPELVPDALEAMSKIFTEHQLDEKKDSELNPLQRQAKKNFNQAVADAKKKYRV